MDCKPAIAWAHLRSSSAMFFAIEDARIPGCKICVFRRFFSRELSRTTFVSVFSTVFAHLQSTVPIDFGGSRMDSVARKIGNTKVWCTVPLHVNCWQLTVTYMKETDVCKIEIIYARTKWLIVANSPQEHPLQCSPSQEPAQSLVTWGQEVFRRFWRISTCGYNTDTFPSSSPNLRFDSQKNSEIGDVIVILVASRPGSTPRRECSGQMTPNTWFLKNIPAQGWNVLNPCLKHPRVGGFWTATRPLWLHFRSENGC